MIQRIFNFQFSIFNSRKQKAFTLVEMLISVGLFTLIATISIGAVLSVFDANKKSQATKSIIDNLNLSIENLTRTVRFGDNYHCGSGGTITNPQDCPNNSVGDTFLALRFKGTTIIYRLNGTAIERSDDGGVNYKAITSSETVVEYLRFYVFGNTADSPSLRQPYVIAVIKGYVGNTNKPTRQSMFSIETLMSQRTLDI